jgi:hypothetical protein
MHLGAAHVHALPGHCVARIAGRSCRVVGSTSAGQVRHAMSHGEDRNAMSHGVDLTVWYGT